MESIDQQLTISIASKDRPEVVEATLRRIHSFGLGECPLILCDDGSSPPLDPPALVLFPRGRLLRNETPQGQAGARNRIARECRTPFLLQLDDDSYPVAGSVTDLLEYARSTEKWLAFAIPFEEPARGRTFPVGIPVDRPLQVKSFVGCSALFHVKNLLGTGGYADWIHGMVEEEELSLRALDGGLHVLSIDLLRVRHEVTDTNRNPSKIALKSYRNWLLLWAFHSPWQALPIRVIRLFFGAVLLTCKKRNLSAIYGMCEGFRDFGRMRKLRQPVSNYTYHEFRSLPHALDFFRSV